MRAPFGDVTPNVSGVTAQNFSPAWALVDERGNTASLARQARLLGAVGHAVIATDLAGVIQFWNQAAERLYGWSASEVMGQDIATVTPTPVSEAEARGILDRLRRGESWSGQFRVRRKDGSTFVAEVTDTPVLDADGALVGIVGVSSDVSERHRSEERARFLADAGRVLAAPLDLDEVLRALSTLPVPAFADYTMVYRVGDDGLAHRVARAHVDPERKALLDVLEREYPLRTDSELPASRVLRTHETLFLPEMPYESWHASAIDERYLAIIRALGPCSGIVVPLVARERALGALVLSMADEACGGSSRRFTDDDLRTARSLADLGALALDNVLLLRDAEQARRAAEEANRAKSAFLAAMSHELRTPLNAIGGYVELIDMGLRGPVTEQQHEDLARIQRSQEHLLGLINDVLSFVRLDTGHVRYHIDRVPVGATLQRVEELVLPQLRAKQLQYARVPCDSSLTLRADDEKVRQILVNLLTNAIKFTEAGGCITVSCAAEGSGERVAIRVRDSGSGIPRDRLEQIFEPFVQLGRQLNHPTDGVGLGLAISRDLARRMEGDVTADSEPGRGSTFTLTLPRG